MIKVVSFIAITIIATCIFLLWQDCIEEEIRGKKYQQEIQECDRRIEKCRKFQELINYDGDDWIIKYQDYMMEYSSYRCYPM